MTQQQTEQAICPNCLSRSEADGPDDPHTPLCAHEGCYRVSTFVMDDEELGTYLCYPCNQIGEDIQDESLLKDSP